MSIAPINAIQSPISLQNQSKTSKTPNNVVEGKKDSVEISKMGSLANELNNLFGIDSYITVEEIKAQRNKVNKDFKGKVISKLNSLGIPCNVKFDLKGDGRGKIVVQGDFKDKDKFEQSLNEDEVFSDSFSQLSCLSSFCHAFDKASKFRSAYAKNPQTAVSQYSYLFNDNNKSEFSFSYDEGKMDSIVKSFFG